MLIVKLFAQARQVVGSSQIQIPWSDGQTAQRLKDVLAERYPALAPLIPRLLVAVNSNYATDQDCISRNDEVACFPPVSGG